MTNDSRIRGKVAAILSKRELVLNIGTEHGVEVGMRFVILNSKGVDVKDPDSGEVIGTVEVPKTVIKVMLPSACPTARGWKTRQSSIELIYPSSR